MLIRPRLYTYRRCPYAIRSRLALYQAKIDYESIEISLKDKPIDFLAPFVHPFWSQLKKNKNVIDFEDFSFCQYNLSKGHVPIDYKLYKEFGHHGEAAHRDFATYLIENYLNEI